jgi:23S rRNA-/tRNA-specific pseudouridylate synthase
LYNPRNLIAKNTPDSLITNIQNFSRQALHASKIRFPSIKGGSFFEFQADLPEDMQSLIKKME